METTELMNNEEVMETVEETELPAVAEECPENNHFSKGEIGALITLLSFAGIGAVMLVKDVVIPGGKWVYGKIQTAKENWKNKKQNKASVNEDEDLVEVTD